MENKSTHGLRLDQLADLLRAAVADDPKPEDAQPKVENGGRKTEDGTPKSENNGPP